MFKLRLLPRLAVLGAIATVLIVVAIAWSLGPARNRPRVIPPEEPRRPVPLSEIDPAAAQDQAKGIYEGPLGEFIVTPREAAVFPPCPQPHRPAQNIKASELYSSVFGENLDESECADGRIINISVYGREAIGRRYYVGAAKVPYEAPLDRLVLLTVAGNRAIAQLPQPGNPGSLRLTVIERLPGGNQPGILVWIDNTGLSLEAAAALAARIMGVRP